MTKPVSAHGAPKLSSRGRREGRPKSLTAHAAEKFGVGRSTVKRALAEAGAKPASPEARLGQVAQQHLPSQASQTASARSCFEKLWYRPGLFASRCFEAPRNSNAQSDYFQREYNHFQIAPSIYSRNGGRAGPFRRLEITVMNAQQLIRFQQDQDIGFQLSPEGIDAATAASLGAAGDREWAAVTEMRTTAASSLAEVAARAELLAGFIERDRFDEEVWADMARRIAIDLRAMLTAEVGLA